MHHDSMKGAGVKYRLRGLRASRHAMAGISLIELMIAITLGLLILAGLASVFANSSASRNELERTGRQIENGRFAMELLNEDIRLAGFYGEYNPKSLTPPAALPDPCSTDPAVWITALPLPLQGYDNGASAPTCVPASLKASTDILVVRRVSTCEAGVSGCAAAVNGAPYIQVSKCATEIPTTPYVLGLQGTATFSLKQKDCTAVAKQRQYTVSIYFISTDNGRGQSIPTLKRMEFNGASFVETPLVEGIEQLNIEYGIDTDGNGSPDVYTADPTTYVCGGCTAGSNWSNVMTARVNLLARNLDTSPGFTDSKTYNLGLDASGTAVTATPADSYRRHVYTGLIRAINPSQRREIP
jgi:type IV pilus assembly protein PilW